MDAFDLYATLRPTRIRHGGHTSFRASGTPETPDHHQLSVSHSKH